MGVSRNTIGCLARAYGLTKSEAGLKAIRKRQTKAMVKTFVKKGYYVGRRPSQATIEGNRRRWQEVKEGIRKDPISTLKERDPKRYNERLKKMSADRKEVIRKEKLRVVYGLERKTRLKAVVMKPYTRSQLGHRCNALKRGYLLDYDCSEGTEGRYVIYWDAETERSAAFERNLIADGFEVNECV